MPSDPGAATGLPTGMSASLVAEAPGPLTGRQLGEFTLRDVIGRGGYGDLYLAEQPALGRDAIVKVLRPDGDPKRVERFLREAQLASRLDHPYAAHIYAFGAEPDSTLWIAMERVRGAALRSLLAAQGPMPLERFVPLLERVCEVVHTAHEQGIVHRDLKPDNIMVISRAGKLMPKLLDFGIARAIEDGPDAKAVAAANPDDTGPVIPQAQAGSTPPVGITPGGTTPLLGITPGGTALTPGRTPQVTTTTQRGAVIGSPSYMAPEVWLDAHGAGPAADQYALAALAYETLTGKVAFTGRTIAEIARAHGKGKLPPLGDGFPSDLDTVLKRALARKHGDRYGNVLEFAQAFRDAAKLDGTADLPRLDDDLRTRFLDGAPKPLADAVAAYDVAKNAHQAREALRGIVRAVARWIGIMALASRSRVGSGTVRDTEHARSLLRELRRHGLTASAWVGLARELTRQFATLPDTHPLPELVLVLHKTDGVDPFTSALDGSLSEGLADGSLDAAMQAITRELPIIAALLRAFVPLCDYQLVVARDGRSESWSGVRGDPRALVRVARAIADDRPVLVDPNGSPVVVVWPLVQVQVAVPGHAPEVFVLAGPGRQGARLVSSPHGFEHNDVGVWDWFRGELLDYDEPAAAAAAETPYRGLAAYTARDQAFYVGRERELEVVANRLVLEPFIAIVGPSGVGKSSFVHAGLAPSLADWRVLTMRPQRAPLAQLGEALGLPDVFDDAAALAKVRTLAGEAAGLLFVIDQFEETITLGADLALRDRFARLLIAAARIPELPIRVVITLRDDFLIRAHELPGFDHVLSAGLHLLAPLDRAALERILVEPARRLGYEFDDPELPARMVASVAGAPAAVALISFTASRLWELRDRHFRQLSKKAYEALGGVGGALARHADETVDAMPEGERALVRKAFRHLITFEGTRAVLGKDELTELLGGGNDAARVIERLVVARLLATSEDESGGGVVEIVHEALVGAWPRLAEWRREDAEGSRLHAQLRAAAKAWHDRGRKRGALWRGDALAEYQLWRKRHPGELAPVEAAFGDASIASEARGRRIRRGLAIAALTIAAVFVALLWRARSTEARMLRAATFDQGRMQGLVGDTIGALPYLIEAYDRGVRSEANRFLIEEALRTTRGRALTLAGHEQRIKSVAYSPDGTKIATASADNTARIWDASTGPVIDTVRLAGIANAVAFSPDGNLLAVAGRDEAIVLWDLAHHREAKRVIRGRNVGVMEFIDGGRALLVTGGETLDIVPIDGRPIVTLLRAPTYIGGMSCAQGTRIATWTLQGVVGLWGLDGKPITSVQATTAVMAGAVSADCKLIVTATELGDVDLVSTDGSPTIHKSHVHDKSINDVAVAPDGKTFVTAAGDVARLWDNHGELIAVLSAQRSGFVLAQFSRRGDLLATANLDGTVRLWETITGTPLGELNGHTATAATAAWSPDGARLVTGSLDHTAIVWDVAKARELDPLPTASVEPSGVHHIVFSPDGTLLASPNGLPDAQNHVLIQRDGRVVCRANEQITDITWRADSRAIAAFYFGEKTARVWDAQTCAVLATLPHPDRVTALVFASDGRLVTGSHDGILRIWDAGGAKVDASAQLGAPIEHVGRDRGGRIWAIAQARTATVTFHDPRDLAVTGTLEGGSTGLTDLVFDAARHRVLGAGSDQYAWVWDDRTNRLVTKLEAGGSLFGLAISPDGTRIVGLGGVSPVVWDAETLDRLGILEGHKEAVLQGTFIADRLLVTTSREVDARVWDMDTLRPLDVIHDALEVANFDGHLVLAGNGTRSWIPSYPPPDEKDMARFRGADRR